MRLHYRTVYKVHLTHLISPKVQGVFQGDALASHSKKGGGFHSSRMSETVRKSLSVPLHIKQSVEDRVFTKM